MPHRAYTRPRLTKTRPRPHEITHPRIQAKRVAAAFVLTALRMYLYLRHHHTDYLV
jgi:hypothetical protein